MASTSGTVVIQFVDDNVEATTIPDDNRLILRSCIVCVCGDIASRALYLQYFQSIFATLLSKGEKVFFFIATKNPTQSLKWQMELKMSRESTSNEKHVQSFALRFFYVYRSFTLVCFILSLCCFFPNTIVRRFDFALFSRLITQACSLFVLSALNSYSTSRSRE